MAVSSDQKLNTKQKMFTEEYLIDLNGTQAAIRAGYSKNAAKEIAYELLTKPHIQKAIAEAKEAREERTHITQDMVIKELSRIAFLDIRKAFDESGNLLPIGQIPEDVARAIGGFETLNITTDDKNEIINKVKIIDKKGALDSLGKHLSMFTDNVNHSGAIDLSSKSDEELQKIIDG